jgi:hypothetical protein
VFPRPNLKKPSTKLIPVCVLFASSKKINDRAPNGGEG